MIAKLEAILSKLDKAVLTDDDMFDSREADDLAREAERNLPLTGLPGCVELVRILAEMISNYIRLTPKQLANPKNSDDGHEGQMMRSQNEPPSGAGGQDPPKQDPSGDDVKPKYAGQPTEGGPATGGEKEPPKQIREPSAFVKRMRALVEELRWFHLRETALILMRRLDSVVRRSMSPASDAARAELMKEAQLIDRMDRSYHDDKETTGQKYRAFTTSTDSQSLRKLIAAAMVAMTPKEGAAGTEIAPLNSILIKLEELQPHVRRFSQGQASGGKD